MSTYKNKYIAIVVLIGANFAIQAHAASSTLRVTCDDHASGAEVSINDKYKGECPIDIQVNEGRHRLKAVKKIAGKDSVFEEEIRIGDGVTKRIEVSFGTAGATQVPSIQIDQKAIAQQRYEAEMDEYNKSIRACLPKHAVELRRLTAAARAGFKQAYLDCRDRFSQGARESDYGPESHYRKMCGTGKFEDGGRDESPEEEELRKFSKNAEYWCAQQFTKPNAP